MTYVLEELVTVGMFEVKERSLGSFFWREGWGKLIFQTLCYKMKFCRSLMCYLIQCLPCDATEEFYQKQFCKNQKRFLTCKIKPP